MQKTAKRFWELDAARGFAVVLMVIFNYAFALRYFGILAITSSNLFWFWLPRFIGALFIFIAGVSLTISYNRKKIKKDVFSQYAKRGLMIFLLGIAITLVTWIFVPQEAVLFGILHLIGSSIIIAPFFFRFKRANLLLGALIILAGIYLQSFSVDTNMLLWLGLKPYGFATLDYFPLMPWFGFFLLGMFFGDVFYKRGKKMFKLHDFSDNVLVSFLTFLGRNSLKIYLLHIPALILFLIALGFHISF